ncbi:MAG: hypothetical protein HS126_03325 [Anaerolineales bacterium]|nr:hypothetical protein [Anaerolineales bacterium]
MLLSNEGSGGRLGSKFVCQGWLENRLKPTILATIFHLTGQEVRLELWSSRRWVSQSPPSRDQPGGRVNGPIVLFWPDPRWQQAILLLPYPTFPTAGEVQGWLLTSASSIAPATNP